MGLYILWKRLVFRFFSTYLNAAEPFANNLARIGY